MSERAVLYLHANLEYVELEGMPAWVDDSTYKLTSPILPSESRFVDGQEALVYSQRGNSRFIYVGVLHNVRLDRENSAIRFERFERFLRPVLIEDGGDRRSGVYDSAGFQDFAYISETSFHEVMRRSRRAAVEPSH